MISDKMVNNCNSMFLIQRAVFLGMSTARKPNYENTLLPNLLFVILQEMRIIVFSHQIWHFMLRRMYGNEEKRDICAIAIVT